MDLVDLIIEKRFLGQEFLTWLWFKSEERGGTVLLPGTGDIQLVFEKHMLLEYGEGEAFEKIICQGLQAELNEARTGLRMGKKLEQARIHLVQGDYEWHMTLKASLLEFRSVKPPKTMAAAEEDNSAEAVEGRLLDRIGMLETATRTIDELFRMFLEIRTSPSAWQAERDRLRKWIHKEH
jgi:recombination associated protein RdgC